MSSSRHLLIAASGLVAVVALGALLLVWPVYREAADVRRQIARFADCGELASRTASIRKLEREGEQLAAWMEAHQRERPAAADVAGLIKALSERPVDGKVIFDRAFTARDPRPAVPGGECPEMAVPLEVTLEARWPAVFELLRQVERLDRLVRIAAVHLEADRRGERDGVAVASVTVEAIFDPSQATAEAAP